MSEAGVGFSLGQVDQLNGWPVGQKEAHSWQVDTLTCWQGEEAALKEGAEGYRIVGWGMR